MITYPAVIIVVKGILSEWGNFSKSGCIRTCDICVIFSLIPHNFSEICENECSIFNPTWVSV